MTTVLKATLTLLILVAALLVAPAPAHAQNYISYVDSSQFMCYPISLCQVFLTGIQYAETMQVQADCIYYDTYDCGDECTTTSLYLTNYIQVGQGVLGPCQQLIDGDLTGYYDTNNIADLSFGRDESTGETVAVNKYMDCNNKFTEVDSGGIGGGTCGVVFN